MALPRLALQGTSFFCPATQRTVTLRGVSLSGNCKIPSGLPSHHNDSAAFYDHANVSYIGRPFPLEDMHAHLARIKEWGFNLVRLVVTWEGLEHAGWQQYDSEYIAYLRKIIDTLPQYGLYCIIDAHQDVFSRLTGGSGAPGWVLPILGLDVRSLHSSYAAHIHTNALGKNDPPASVWPSGYQKLAAATCNTCFWAGNTFAWKNKAPNGQGLSSFLQGAMMDAFGQLADALEGCEAILGFEPMNEPHRGYLELHSMYTFDPNTDLQFGYHPSALESFALGDGIPTTIPYYVHSFPHPTSISHYSLANPSRTRAWASGSKCIWRDHGVWDVDPHSGKPVVLRHTYFEKDPRTGEEFEWYRDAWRPFLIRFRERIVSGKEERKHWFTFAAGVPNELATPWPNEEQPDNLVSAPHFYDLHALFSKSFGTITYNVQGLSKGMFPLKALYYGRSGVRDNYALQLKNIVAASHASTRAPCIIGEIGLPFDMNAKSALKQAGGSYEWQERMMDALCVGMERAKVSYVLWNYNPDNEDEHGDGWYLENFSLFSKSHLAQTGEGGRCLDAFQRPYVIATPGEQIRTYFDMFSMQFIYEFRNFRQAALPASEVKQEGTSSGAREESKSKVVEVYLPRRRYAALLEKKQAEIRVSNGTFSYNPETQILSWTIKNTKPGVPHRIEVRVPDSAHWKPVPATTWLVPFLVGASAILLPIVLYLGQTLETYQIAVLCFVAFLGGVVYLAEIAA